MKTLPTPISTGLSSNLAQFWLVKVEGSAATYYWTTQSKNLTAQSLILKDSTVTVTADSGVIAKFVDGEQQTGISQIEFGVDISQGGGISSAADVEIDILNQDRKDTTILTAPNRLEYRPVTVYMGFIPAGASPTVEITTDLLQMWTGVVDDVLDFDYGHFRLACTDGVFLRHKSIPTTIIDETTYPYAPEESLNRPLPDLYGDFMSSSATALYNDIMYERKFPAPTILVDDSAKKFVIAGHICHTVPGTGTPFVGDTSTSMFYFFDSGLNVYGTLNTIDSVTNTPTAFVNLTTSYATADFYFQPKVKGVLTDSAISDYQAGVDKKSTTYASMSMTGSKEDLYYRTNRSPSSVTDAAAIPNIVLDLGTVDAGFTGTIKFKKDGGVLSSTGTTFTNTDSNTRKTSTLTSDTISEFPEYQFGIEASGSNGAQIKNVCLELDGVNLSGVSAMRPYGTGGLGPGGPGGGGDETLPGFDFNLDWIRRRRGSFWMQ